MGIDWGGSKIEAAVLNEAGQLLKTERIATPQSYDAALQAVRALIAELEAQHGTCTLGFGTPGSLSPKTGLMRNANSVWLNNQPLKADLEQLLGREVRLANDANCFALSEATDGAGEGAQSVAGLILGTGFGAGLVINGQIIVGAHGIGGELGHVPLSHVTDEDKPANCWCGKQNCHEIFVSGSGFERSYRLETGEAIKAPEIIKRKQQGEVAANKVYARYVSQLARAVSTLCNIFDPEVIVLGGGMGQINGLEADLSSALPAYLFSDYCAVSIVKPKYGDASGVRGAAWLWN
jgi:fructokinase